MISSRIDKARMLFVLCTTLAVGCGSGPDPNSPARLPLDPLLDAVLQPGPWLRFARHTQPADVYEALPSASVILRMASAYDGTTTSITIKYLSDGTTAELEQVATSDLVRRQALATQGYFEIVAGAYGYSVIVVPRADQRAGAGFDIVMVNRNFAANRSVPLDVHVRPRVARTLPSDVFFDCGNDYDTIEGKYYTNCKAVRSHHRARHHATRLADRSSAQLWRTLRRGLALRLHPRSRFHRQDVWSIRRGCRDQRKQCRDGSSLVTKGNPPDTRQAGLPIRDVAPTGESRGITLNSFSLPGNHPGDHPEPDRRLCIIAELNAWHPFAQGGIWSTHWWGRGPAPAGWMTRVTNIDDRSARGNRTRSGRLTPPHRTAPHHWSEGRPAHLLPMCA